MTINKTALEHHQFYPKAQGFHPENALFLAKHARLAYEEPNVKQYVCKDIWGFSQFQFIEFCSDTDDVQAYLTANSQSIIVVFRGTEPDKLQDWVNNMDTQLTDRFRGSVHKGFMRCVDLVWEEIRAAILLNYEEGKKVFFCGHSQGGALATLAAARALDENIPVHQVYTIGQPRVGNLLFASFFNKAFKQNLFRIVNYGDIITRAPTRKSSYSHCGTFVFLDKDGTMHTDSSHWKNFWDDLGLSIWDLLDMTLSNIEEHKTSSYIEKLAAL